MEFTSTKLYGININLPFYIQQLNYLIDSWSFEQGERFMVVSLRRYDD